MTAAIPVLASVDPLKEVDEKGGVVRSIDRARVLARQMWEQFGLRETAPAG